MPGHQTTNNLHILFFPCTGNRMGNSWASSHMKTNGLSDSPLGNLMRYSSWGRQSTMFTYPRRQLVGYCDGKRSLQSVKKELIQLALTTYMPHNMIGTGHMLQSDTKNLNIKTPNMKPKHLPVQFYYQQPLVLKSEDFKNCFH